MAIPEQFSLRWNDFHSNLSQSFHALLEGEDLVDVTLAAGGQYVHAHKLILSVCSPYFKELFKMNPCEHPIVILKDVAHQELKQLLQFMYRGEVHVRQQELSGFLHTAELLQVKGLTGGRERSESPPPVEECPAKTEPVEQPEWVPGGDDTIATEAPAELVVKEESRSPLKRLLKSTPTKNSVPGGKKKPRPVDSPAPDNNECVYDGEPLIDFDSDLYHSILAMPESAKEAGFNCKTRGVKCPSCHRFFANRYNLKVHIRDKHDTREGTLQCEICNKRMRNPSCLRVHMYHHRKQAAYLAQLPRPDRDLVPKLEDKTWARADGAYGGPVDYRDQEPVPNIDDKGWAKADGAIGGAVNYRDQDPVPNIDDKGWAKADGAIVGAVNYRDQGPVLNIDDKGWAKADGVFGGAVNYRDQDPYQSPSPAAEAPSRPPPGAEPA